MRPLLRCRTYTHAVNEALSANRRRAALLLGGSGAAVGLAVWLVVATVIAVLTGPVAGMAIGVVLGVAAGCAAAWTARRDATAVVVRAAGATLATVVAEPGFHNVVEGLCVAAGLPKPALYVVDDEALNLCAAGLDHRGAAVLATSGLLRALTRIELEGVVAHALTRIKTMQIVPETLAVTTVGLPVLLAERGNGLAGAVAPTFARLLGRVVSANDELTDDMEGLMLTRYPPGLIAALEKMRAQGSALRRPSIAIDHLWLAPAVAAADGQLPHLAALVGAHDALADRLEALREL